MRSLFVRMSAAGSVISMLLGMLSKQNFRSSDGLVNWISSSENVECIPPSWGIASS